MKIFDPENPTRSPRHEAIYAVSELAYTLVDVIAALMFVIGSICFFYPELNYAGTWLFLFGSLMFGLRPTIKLMREIAYLRMSARSSQARRR